MIGVEQAQALIAGALRLLPAEVVGLEQAFGRVLAEDVVARHSQPPVDVSAMDGWAVRAADVGALPAVLRQVGTAAAGAAWTGTLGEGEAVRIFTGAPVPAGADTIVIQEHATAEAGGVTVLRTPAPGRHVRAARQDFAAGSVVLRAGRRLGPREIGLVAAAGVPWLAVRRRPRVAVLSTGDELVLPGEPCGPSQIVESAGFAAAALLRQFGAEPVLLGIARDDERALAHSLDQARGCDLLVTIGGVSVGDFDLVRRVLDGGSVDLSFHKVAMRPGKPLLFGRIGDLPVLGLPGNPVSAFVTLLVFGRRAVDSMLGVPPPAEAASAILGRELPGNDLRQDYLRASLHASPTGDLVATPFMVQDSAMLRVLVGADCLVIRPPSAPPAAMGERVPIIPLGDGVPRSGNCGADFTRVLDAASELN